jgi:hypothetical protein
VSDGQKSSKLAAVPKWLEKNIRGQRGGGSQGVSFGYFSAVRWDLYQWQMNAFDFIRINLEISCLRLSSVINREPIWSLGGSPVKAQKLLQ